MTGAGTNTWLIQRQDTSEDVQGIIVVDPGPDVPGHLAAISRVGPVRAILLSHGHADHAASARRWADHLDVPVYAADPRFARGVAPLLDAQVIHAAGLSLTVIATPGHTSDSVAFLLHGDSSLPDAAGCAGVSGDRARGDDHAGGDGRDSVFTGDTLLGTGSTAVPHPEGSVADHLVSLERLVRLLEVRGFPGHGPVIDDLSSAAAAAISRRMSRVRQLDQLARQRALDTGGPASIPVLTARMYPGIEHALRPVAERTVHAQLVYLRLTQAGCPDE